MKYLTGESATALDAPRVGCAMDGMATDIYKGLAGDLWKQNIEQEYDGARSTYYVLSVSSGLSSVTLCKPYLVLLLRALT